MAEDLISRGVLLRRIYEVRYFIEEQVEEKGLSAEDKKYLFGRHDAFTEAMQIVREMPEVIRCKDCYYWSKKESQKMNGFRLCSRIDEYTTDEGYCSFAYEKED